MLSAKPAGVTAAKDAARAIRVTERLKRLITSSFYISRRAAIADLTEILPNDKARKQGMALKASWRSRMDIAIVKLRFALTAAAYTNFDSSPILLKLID